VEIDSNYDVTVNGRALHTSKMASASPHYEEGGANDRAITVSTLPVIYAK
jgi:hypothetical protein